MFDIRFLDSKNDASVGGLLALGEIVVGDFREKFECSLEFWSKSQYEGQWREGIKRVAETDLDSCLITSLTDPTTANFIFWWPLYRDRDDCVVHNHLLLLDELDVPFDPSNPYRFIPRRRQFTEEGEPISEWRVPLHELRQWNSAN